MPEGKIKGFIKGRQAQPPAGYEARLDALLSDLTQAPAATRRNRPRLALALAIALALLGISAAIAASLGVFERFAQQAHDRQRMQQLGHAATDYQNKIEIPGDTLSGFPDTVFTLDQAHYDGESLYISYQLSASNAPLSGFRIHGEQPGQDMLDKAEEMPIEKLADILTDSLGQEAWASIRQQLSEQGWLQLRTYTQYLGDSAVLDGYTTFYPTRTDAKGAEQGGKIGFWEFARPLPEAARNQEQLDISLTLYRETRTYYLTKEAACLLPGGERLALPLDLHILKDHAASIYTAKAQFDDYQVEAQAKVSAVDIKVDLLLHATNGQITDVLDTGASAEETGRERITGFALYANGQRCRMVEGSFQMDGEAMRIQLGFLAPEAIQTLVVVPEYNHGHERTKESLTLIPIP